MKKNGKCDCGRPAAPAVAACEREAGDSSRNRKMYLTRLEEAGLTKAPTAAKRKAPNQVELARIAAELSKAYPGASPGELAGRAMEFWNATGSTMFVEQMAEYLVRGVCYFDREDWEAHCRTLVALFDDAKGAVPGQSPSKYFRESNKQARVKAGAAVLQVWTRGSRDKHGEEVIRALFPAKSETEDGRAKKLLSLLEFAKAKVNSGGCDELTWRATDGNRLKACLLHAWGPLGFPPEDARMIEMAALGWLELPKNVAVSNLGALPMLARWLAVMRMEQAAEAKSRA